MTVSDRATPLARRAGPTNGSSPLQIVGPARAVALALDIGLCTAAAVLLGNAFACSACAQAPGDAARMGLLAGLLLSAFGLSSQATSRAALLKPPFALLVGNWLKTMALLGAFAALPPAAPKALTPLALFGLLGLMAVLAGRELLALALATAYDRGMLSRFRTFVLARTTEEAEALARTLAMEADCQAVAALSTCAVEGVLARIHRGGIDRVVVKTGGLARDDLADLLDRLRTTRSPVHFLAGAPRLTGFQRPVDEMGALPVFAVKRGPLSRSERWAKRAFDVAVASAALVLIAPVLLAVALVLRAAGRRVIHRQASMGFDGHAFALLSFAGTDGGEPHASGLLSRSGLAGLPRLLNVVRGDVSLVGPRPLGVSPNDADRKVARFAASQGLKPGLAYGFLAESPLGAPRRDADRRLLRSDDLAYLDQWSFMLDLAVLASGLGRSCIAAEPRPA